MWTIFCPGLKAFLLTSLKVQYVTQISQLKCKCYNVRLNAVIKNTKSQILVDYILHAYNGETFQKIQLLSKFLVLPTELLTLFYGIYLAFT